MTEQPAGTNRLTRQMQILAKAQYALAALLLAAGVVFYFGAHRPQQIALAELSRQTSAKLAELDSDRMRTDKLPRVQLELAALKRRLEGFKKLPEDPQFGQFLHEINQASQNAGLQQLKVEPGLGRRLELFSEQPVVLSFSGNFTSVASFIRQLEDLERLTRLRELSVHQIDPRQGTVDVKLSVNIYYAPVPASAMEGS